MDESRVLIAGGTEITEDHPKWGPLIGDCRQSFLFDVTSGEWTRLRDLPEPFTNPAGYHLPDGRVVLIWKETWAALMPNGDWEVDSNLQGSGLKAIILVLAGNTWIGLPLTFSCHFSIGSSKLSNC